MALTKREKQNLYGPAVVGALFGVFAALASVAFDSEYGAHVYPNGERSLLFIIVRAGLFFSSVMGGCCCCSAFFPSFCRVFFLARAAQGMAMPNPPVERDASQVRCARLLAPLTFFR
jgi:hypothetical protein